MIINTSELEGAALDWAVAITQGWEPDPLRPAREGQLKPVGRQATSANATLVSRLPYSTDWAHGGPLIERYWIDFHGMVGEVEACVQESVLFSKGETHLVAAMRSIVEHVLGSEVDVPEELV